MEGGGAPAVSLAREALLAVLEPKQLLAVAAEDDHRLRRCHQVSASRRRTSFERSSHQGSADTGVNERKMSQALFIGLFFCEERVAGFADDQIFSTFAHVGRNWHRGEQSPLPDVVARQLVVG